MPLKRRPLIERLMCKVSEGPGGCWIFGGSKNPEGYGRVSEGGHAGRTLLAHRATYEYFIAAVPPGLQLDHLCRVPECVNPWHLDPVTALVNVSRSDKTRIGQTNRLKTRCPQGHPYDQTNTRVNKHGWRRCLTCHNAGPNRSAA